MPSHRHLISTLLLFLPALAARGQSIFADKYLQSPNMNSLGEYGDVPVSLYTGIPEVSLPLLEIGDGTHSIPISLSYHGGGVRPDSHPGWVGMGWTLHAGGSISRVVGGLPDESDNYNAPLVSHPGSFYHPKYGCLYNKRGNLGGKSGFNDDIIADKEDPGNPQEGNLAVWDMEMDQFSFNFMGYSGKFYYTRAGWTVDCDTDLKVILDVSDEMANTNMPKVFMISADPPHSQVFRECRSRSISNFLIIDPQGTKYYFGGKDRPDAIEYSVGFFAQHNSEIAATAWHLTRIEYTDGQVVDFRYEKNHFVAEMGISESFIQTSTLNPMDPRVEVYNGVNVTENTDAGGLYTGRDFADGSLVAPSYLSSIECGDYLVEFDIAPTRELRYPMYSICRNHFMARTEKYGDWNSLVYLASSDVYGNPASNNKGSSLMLDALTWYKLTDITLKAGGNVQRKFHFSYNDEDSVSQGTMRLALLEVREDGVGSHSFEYDRIHLLPDYCSYDVDHWGFYADTGIATRLDDAYQYGQRACKLTDPSYHARREPQPQKATIGSLMKINYPTGGYTRFVYEPNSYCREVNADRDGLRLHQDERFAGGVRVKEIYNNASADPACEFLFKRFVYRDVTDSADTVHTSGILLQPPCYRHFNKENGQGFTFRNDCYNAQSVRRLGSNPDVCHIGYSCVSEIGPDKSVTVYRFVDFADRPDDRLQRTDLYFQYHVPYLSWAARRGHLKSRREYSDTHLLLRETTYVYTYLRHSILASQKCQVIYHNGWRYTDISPCGFLTGTKRDYQVCETEYWPDGSSMELFSQLAYNSHLLPMSTEKLFPDGSSEHREILYTSDFPDNPLYKAMADANLLAFPVSDRLTRLDKDWENETLLQETLYTYTDGNWMCPASESVRRGSGSHPSSLRREFGLHGRPVAEQGDDPDDLTIYVWGYAHRYIVATVKGASLDQVKAGLGDLDVFAAAPVPDFAKLSALQKNLPSALVTIYDRKPGFGINRITSPDKTALRYHYDSTGRLSYTSDRLGHPLEIYDWQYAPQGSVSNWLQTAVATRSNNSRSAALASALVSRDLFDGLGRKVASRSWRAGSSSPHIASLSELDGRGRPVRAWLPAPVSGDVDSPLSAESLRSAYADPLSAFSATVYEAAPAGRPVSASRPSNARPDGSTPSISTEYLCNSASSASPMLRCRLVTLAGNIVSGNAWYDPGSLRVTRITDEDGEISLSFTDIRGLKVLDRRVSSLSGEFFDTRYLYDSLDRPVLVLPPSVCRDLERGVSLDLSDSQVRARCFSYAYDRRGRVRSASMPGAAPSKTAYTPGGKPVLVQDGALKASSRVVRTAYDPLGRRAFTAMQHDDGSLFALADSICGLRSSTTFIASLSGEGALYGYRRPPHGPSIARDDLLSADYYDDYNFLRHFPQHADSLAFSSVNGRDPRGDLRLTFSTAGHLTGSARRVIPHSGSGPLLPSAFYYDERGRLVQSVAANHLGGYDRTALSLSFDGRVLASTHIHSSPDTLIIAERIFDWNEDLAPSAVRMRVNGGPWTILTASVYDDFRRTVSVGMIDGGLKVDYVWADSGELQSISSEPFSQTLYRRSVPPGAPASLKPLFNGRVCAESFSLAESPGANGRKLAASYSYSYDGPRLLSADYAEASRSERPLSGIAAGSVSCQDPDYSVRYSWNPDSAPLSIRRHGLADRSVSSSPFPSPAGSRTICTYGLVDDISLSWKGPRLDRADDNAEDCTLSIATDFSEKVRRDGEYAYDPDGRLSRDSNKGVTISYNILGLPSLVCDGVNRIRRTYDSLGTLLRAEYGTERIEFTSPEPGQVGAIVATPVFDLARVADRCGPVEYADHAVERYIHEAGWIDSHGRHVAAVRDCRGSLRATWTAHSALPPAPGNGSNNTNGNNSGSSNSTLTLPGQGIGQVLPAGNVYADLTAYYPFGLPFADWQGASRDLFSGKELERSGNLLDYDFHARRLDPQLLIFDKPDPLAANYPHLNPYLYCAANPVSLTDPSGMYVEEGSFSEFNQSKVDRMMEVLKYSKSFSTMFGMMCDNTFMTLRIEQGEGLVNEEGKKNPARFDPKKNTIYLDFNQMMFNSEGDLENIPWLGVFEEFYHGYQNMFSDIFNTNRNPEFEAKVFSMGAYWETYEDFRAPKDFGRLGNNYMIDNCTIFDNLTNGKYNLSFTTLNSNAFVNEYISSGHSFVQYWINEGKAGRRVPFAYDWPVTHVPQTLKALSFRTFLKTNLSNFLNR